MTVNSAGDALSKGVWWQVVTSSNLNLQLKLFFYSPIIICHIVFIIPIEIIFLPANYN